MRKYELVLVFQNALKEAERTKLTETIKGWLKPARNASQSDAGGDIKVVKEEEWGEKPFTYPIKRQKSGFYHLMHLEGETFPTEFEKRVYGNEQVLRHLIIRTK